MNTLAIQLFDKLMDYAMIRFSELPIVKTAVFTDNTCHLAEKVKYITQLNVECFKNLGWLPKEVQFFNRVIYGNSESFSEIIPKDPVLSQIYEYLPTEESTTTESPTAFHRHFVILPDFYSVNGLLWFNSAKQFFICLSECSIPRDTIAIPSGRFAYLSDLLEQYDSILNPSLKDWISEKEISFNKLQRDSKLYWNDTFHNYYMKTKIIESIGEILFTSKTLKEIAIKHKFGKYPTMYKTFKKYAIELTKIFRFSKI